MSFKSFLDWINKGPGDRPEKKSKIDWSEKRRDNRVDLDMGRHLSVHLMNEHAKDGAATLVASVTNVSVRGISIFFANKKDLERIKVGQVLVASLAVDDFPIPLKVEVVRLIGGNGAAIRFKPPFPRELEKLEKFLEPRCLGRSLREIDRSKLQAQRKDLRWFQGVNETHLFSWHDPETGKITQQQLVFLDRVVEWKEGNGLKTGKVRADEGRALGEIKWITAELLNFDARADAAVLKQARTLIESSAIDTAVKKIFLSKF